MALFRSPCAALVLACTLAASLGGCGMANSPSEDAIATFSLTTRAGITDYAVDPDPLKRASAGFFRDIAAVSQTSEHDILARQVREAIYAEKGVHQSLGPAVKSQMATMIAALNDAQQRDDRKALALAALEAFRLLTQDQSTAAKVPAAITLIDYASLLCSTQLSSGKPDWQAMEAALVLADQQMQVVTADLNDSRLSSDFAESLANLQAATERQDMASALHALAQTHEQFVRLKGYFERA